MTALFENKIVKYQNHVALIHPKAIGGNITYEGDYATHTFLTSGQFIVIIPGVVEVLLVGGGGGGKVASSCVSATSRGGGGGGGGVKIESISLNIGSYNVIVGAGGTIGMNGGASSFDSILDVSGGYSGISNPTIGGTSGTNYTSTGAGSGGSGAGGSGLSAPTSTGGIGINGYGGGGGGAGSGTFVNGRTGGDGVDGGGNGAHYYLNGDPPTNGTDGTPNTGGGGGAGVCQPVGGSLTAGAGGSGIVKIKYKYK